MKRFLLALQPSDAWSTLKGNSALFAARCCSALPGYSSAVPLFLLLCACSSPPKSDVPPLNPEEANSLLHYNSKASGWLTYVQKQNTTTGCAFHVDLPDQSSKPTEIDLDNIVWCGTKPAPREFSASVVFIYDKAQKHWILGRFSS